MYRSLHQVIMLPSVSYAWFGHRVTGSRGTINLFFFLSHDQKHYLINMI